MHDDNTPEDRKVTPEDRKVKGTTEARQGQVSKGTPIRWVLVVSTVLAALALLIVFLFFAGG